MVKSDDRHTPILQNTSPLYSAILKNVPLLCSILIKWVVRFSSSFAPVLIYISYNKSIHIYSVSIYLYNEQKVQVFALLALKLIYSNEPKYTINFCRYTQQTFRCYN